MPKDFPESAKGSAKQAVEGLGGSVSPATPVDTRDEMPKDSARRSPANDPATVEDLSETVKGDAKDAVNQLKGFDPAVPSIKYWRFKSGAGQEPGPDGGGSNQGPSHSNKGWER
ncbi:MAG: hypothetical protein NW215_00485 [Hyphomicrobiales bacterium]|nr:hypothetical protein [Hyphomicrobiales bacterium]